MGDIQISDDSEPKSSRFISLLRTAAEKFQAWNIAHGKAVRSFERGALFQYLALLAGFGSFIFLGASFFALREEFSFREEERHQRKLDRLEAAWTRLLRPIGGNTGKGPALEYIMKTGADMSGLNLSCDSVNGTYENQKLRGYERIRCNGAIWLADAEIPARKIVGKRVLGDYFQNSVLLWNLSGAEIFRIKANHISFAGDLRYTRFGLSTLNSSRFYRGNATNFIVHGSSVRYSNFIIGKNVRVQGSDITGAEFVVNDVADLGLIISNISEVSSPPKCKIRKTIDTGTTENSCNEILWKQTHFCITPEVEKLYFSTKSKEVHEKWLIKRREIERIFSNGICHKAGHNVNAEMTIGREVDYSEAYSMFPQHFDAIEK